MREQFQKQGSLVEINPPVIVCGDTHGQFNDVLRLFERGGFPATASYLFLGGTSSAHKGLLVDNPPFSDYVDRGRQNLETILLLFCYKVRWRATGRSDTRLPS